jgi:hypothetical protein
MLRLANPTPEAWGLALTGSFAGLLTNLTAGRASRIPSPDDLEAFVQVERVVRRHNRDVFHEGLRDDLAVEGIGMMRGQIEQPEGMLFRIRLDPQSKISDACHRVSLGERELPSRLFDGDLG